MTLKLVAVDDGTSPDTRTKEYWERLAKTFTAQHPKIKIDVRVMDRYNVDGFVNDMIARGDSPDIVQTEAFADYASRDLLYSVDKVVSVSVQSDFLSQLSAASQLQTVPYGIPFSADSRMLYYNTRLFERAGISGPPRTWNQLSEDAELLKLVDVRIPFGLPLAPGEAQADAMVWLLGNEGGYTNEIGGYALDSTANIETFGWLKDHLVTPGLTGGDPSRANSRQVFDAFVKGDVGMVSGPPSLASAARDAGVPFKVASIPGRDGVLRQTLGTVDWLAAFKKGGHRDQITQFLDYVYQPKNTRDFRKRYHTLPVTTTQMNTVREDSQQRALWPFLNRLESAEFYPTADPLWWKVSTEVNNGIGPATRNPFPVLHKLQQSVEAQTSASPKR